MTLEPEAEEGVDSGPVQMVASSPGVESRWVAWRGKVAGASVAVAVLGIGVAFGHRVLDSYDSWIMLQVSHSIVVDHSLHVASDPLFLNLPYSSYGIGMSLLWLPAEWLGLHLGFNSVALAMLVNPIVTALTAVTLYAWARVAKASISQAVAVALLVTLATPLLPYAVTGFAEPGVALAVAGALLGIELLNGQAIRGALVAGAATSFAVLMRPDSLVLVAPIVLVSVVLITRRWQPVAAFGIALSPALLITGAYNAVRFGSPLVTQYQGLPLSRQFNHSFIAGLYGQTISPGRGIVLYAPLILVAAVGLRWSWQRSPVLTSAAVAFLLVRIVFYSPWWAWNGGAVWGPRFLVPAMPALAVPLLEVVRRLRAIRWSAIAAAAIVATLSIGVQILGVTTRVDPSRFAGLRRARLRRISQPWRCPKARRTRWTIRCSTGALSLSESVSISSSEVRSAAVCSVSRDRVRIRLHRRRSVIDAIPRVGRRRSGCPGRSRTSWDRSSDPSRWSDPAGCATREETSRAGTKGAEASPGDVRLGGVATERGCEHVAPHVRRGHEQ